MNALLVDLDDTLLDYSGGIGESWREACVTCCTSTSVDVETLVGALAETRQWFWSDPARQRGERVNMLRAWQRIAAHALEGFGVSGDGLAAALAREYAARRRAAMQLFPDARECLERLRAAAVPLALVTNGDAGQQRDKIDRFELAGFFDVIVIEGEFGTGKPDEVVYRHALERLGVEAHDAWMVGDHLEFDVAAPQRLGLRGIWLDRPGAGLADQPVRPHRIIRTLAELTV